MTISGIVAVHVPVPTDCLRRNRKKMGKKLKRATKLYHKKRLGESLDKNHRRKPKKKSNNAKVEKPSKGDHAVPAKAPAPKKMETYDYI